MTVHLVVAGVVLGYELWVRYQMAKPVKRAATYNRVFARVLHVVTSDRMRFLSLWRTCWAKYPPTDPRGRLSAEGERHEFDGHIENPNQWAGHPRLFPFRYLYRLARFGYDKHPDEQEARRIAGQPER